MDRDRRGKEREMLQRRDVTKGRVQREDWQRKRQTDYRDIPGRSKDNDGTRDKQGKLGKTIAT